jgi:hypothetical protein
VVEVFLREEVLRLADPAERLEDEAVAVRRGGVDVLQQISLLQRIHALEREVDYLGAAGYCGLCCLRRENRGK